MFFLGVLIFGYLAFVVCHNFFFFVVSYAYSEKKYFQKEPDGFLPILVLIPAYKEDEVILHTTKTALSHNYPSDKFKVVIIADSLKPQTIESLQETKAQILEVHFEQSTKVRALKEALSQQFGYEIAVILDADNIMTKGFLLKINQAYQNGYRCIQGRRIAKNTNTQFAFLDGISEGINNRLLRQGYSAMNMSVTLIGSGMAFPLDTLKKHINAMDSIGGFDRELSLRLLTEHKKVNYLASAIVLDQKVEHAKIFANQRRRWLSSQMVYLKRNFKEGIKQLFKGNLAFFEAAVISNILLPRVLTVGILFIIAILQLALYHFDMISRIHFFPLFFLGIYALVLILAIPPNFINRRLFYAALKIPQAFFLMFLNLFKLKNANKKFIHTPHTSLADSNIKNVK